MQGGHERRWLAGEQRKRIVIEVKVQDIEIRGTPAHLFQHCHMQGARILDRTVEPQRSWPYRGKFRGGAGVTAGEKRDLVIKGHEFLSQPMDYPLGAAVKLRRDGLGQRCDLRNAHETVLLAAWGVDRKLTRGRGVGFRLETRRRLLRLKI